MWLGVGGRCDQCRRRTVGEQRQNVHAVQHHLATTLLFGPETTFKHENPKSQLNSAFKPIGWLREPPVANLYKHISCKNGRAVGGHYISISLSLPITISRSLITFPHGFDWSGQIIVNIFHSSNKSIWSVSPTAIIEVILLYPNLKLDMATSYIHKQRLIDRWIG